MQNRYPVLKAFRNRSWAAYLLSCVFAFSTPLSYAQQAGADAAAEPAGHIVTVTGEVRAVNASGADRPLTRRAPVFEGDTVITAAAGSAQIRMIDGALIALKESTEFAFVAYQYEQNPGSDVSTLELFQGGFRTISGGIGQQNRAAYETRVTNFATIGIRGTDYEVVITPQGTLLTGVYDGGTTVA